VYIIIDLIKSSLFVTALTTTYVNTGIINKFTTASMRDVKSNKLFISMLEIASANAIIITTELVD
jgi:hypothetical protein